MLLLLASHDYDRAPNRYDDGIGADLVAGPSAATSLCAAPRLRPSSPRKSPLRRIGDRRSSHGEAGGGTEGYHLVLHQRPRNKGRETQNLIKIAMERDGLCALLEEPELETILETMEYFEFRAGELIVEEGKTGNTFFVTQTGRLEVSVNGKVCNTIGHGKAFGGRSLLYNCPRTATVKALEACGVWGANGTTFHKVLQENAQKHYSENRSFLDSIRLFDGLSDKQKGRVGEAAFTEVFQAGARVVTEGDMTSVIYLVKTGELKMCRGGTVKSNGDFVDGTELSRLGLGDYFGERAAIQNEPQDATVVAAGKCHLLCISVGDLREVFGSDLAACLQRNFLLLGLKKSPVISQFTSAQQSGIAKAMDVRDYAAGTKIEKGFRFIIVVDGKLTGFAKRSRVTLERGQWYEDATIVDSHCLGTKSDAEHAGLCDLVTGSSSTTRLGILTKEGFANALKELGLSAVGGADDASDYTRKMVLVKKVHIFRHLSEEQTHNLVKALSSERHKKGTYAINQGEVGTSFFVIASGEVSVMINDEHVRTLGKNAYFGERALLFDEPRTASVKVSSTEAELWSIEKSTFSQIVKGNMQEDLMYRIRLQDTSVELTDVRPVQVIGAGATGVVRLVEHKKTHTRYALKRVPKLDGKIPEEVKRECDLLKENDHPFIMTLVRTFERQKYVYILTELITGGELHNAIRQIPTVLSRAHAQFYTGSLVIILEELAEKNIVYRDLKPENVMLDQQGYLKLIDFGIAKKLPEGKNRTFTLIGTPHYMAPEIIRGHGYGTEVDLWSLGVMLFEFVCGYLPFGDDLEDPTEVCTAVLRDPLKFPTRYRDQTGQALVQGLVCRQPKKRLGSGLQGYDEVKSAEYFKVGHSDLSLFNKIMGRELEPPVVPAAETYCGRDGPETNLSDAEDLN